MKPKEFIQHFVLERGWRPQVQKEFLASMTSELLAFLEYNKAADNIKGFDNAVKVIRMKWDAISNKIPYGLPEKLWAYFWATTVVKLREEFCPRETERRRAEAAERKAHWERMQQLRKERREFYENAYREAMYERIALLYMILNSVPTEAFDFLGLQSNATEDVIKQRYREMSLKMHPDRGGDQEQFIYLTECKNKCLKWAANHN